MIIYQIHKEHGKHMANTLMEAELNEKNGWKTVTETEFYGDIPKREEKSDEAEKAHEAEPEEAGEEVLEEIPRAVLEELYEARYGEKPHHRMKDATIKAKLNDD